MKTYVYIIIVCVIVVILTLIGLWVGGVFKGKNGKGNGKGNDKGNADDTIVEWYGQKKCLFPGDNPKFIECMKQKYINSYKNFPDPAKSTMMGIINQAFGDLLTLNSHPNDIIDNSYLPNGLRNIYKFNPNLSNIQNLKLLGDIFNLSGQLILTYQNGGLVLQGQQYYKDIQSYTGTSGVCNKGHHYVRFGVEKTDNYDICLTPKEGVQAVINNKYTNIFANNNNCCEDISFTYTHGVDKGQTQTIQCVLIDYQTMLKDMPEYRELMITPKERKKPVAV